MQDTHVTQVDGFGSGEGWSIRGTVDKTARIRVEGSDFEAYAKDDLGMSHGLGCIRGTRAKRSRLEGKRSKLQMKRQMSHKGEGTSA